MPRQAGKHAAATVAHVARPPRTQALAGAPPCSSSRRLLLSPFLPAGYGHGDLGRAALDEVVAEVMGAEAAAVRIQYVSGTHAIASALYGCLRCGV